jgi:hypothetical protein
MQNLFVLHNIIHFPHHYRASQKVISEFLVLAKMEELHSTQVVHLLTKKLWTQHNEQAKEDSEGWREGRLIEDFGT